MTTRDISTLLALGAKLEEAGGAGIVLQRAKKKRVDAEVRAGEPVVEKGTVCEKRKTGSASSGGEGGEKVAGSGGSSKKKKTGSSKSSSIDGQTPSSGTPSNSRTPSSSGTTSPKKETSSTPSKHKKSPSTSKPKKTPASETTCIKKPKNGLTEQIVLTTLCKLLVRDDSPSHRLALSLALRKGTVRLHLSHTHKINRKLGKYLHLLWGALKGISRETTKFRADAELQGPAVKANPAGLLNVDSVPVEHLKEQFLHMRRLVGAWASPRILAWLKKGQGELERFKEWFEKEVFMEGTDDADVNDFMDGLEMMGNLLCYANTHEWKEGEIPPVYESVMAILLKLSAKFKVACKKKRSQVNAWERACFKDTRPPLPLQLHKHLCHIYDAASHLQVLTALAQSKPLTALQHHHLQIFDIIGTPQPLDLPPTNTAWDLSLTAFEANSSLTFTVPTRSTIATSLHESFSPSPTALPHPEATLQAYHHTLATHAYKEDGKWSTYNFIAVSSSPCVGCRTYAEAQKEVYGTTYEMKGSTKKFEFPWVMPGKGRERKAREVRLVFYAVAVGKVKKLYKKVEGRRKKVVKKVEAGTEEEGTAKEASASDEAVEEGGKGEEDEDEDMGDV